MAACCSSTCATITASPRSSPTGLVNPKLPTGEIEVYIRDLEVLGPADELPLQVFGDQDFPEETRLRYRYLDLRRDGLHQKIMLRSSVIRSLRQRMWDQGFTEFQTPIITASSPEGARDFLVPSRLHPGKFYALPQAPQIFKQLIMVSGFDRYFQIAPCFRDEDPRADRSPTDFYQLDLEMSFVTQDEVFAAVQPVVRGIFEEFGKGRKVDTVWPQIPYAEALLKYGSDKPDLRNPIVMQDVSDHFRGSGFAIFAKLLEQPGTEIRAIPAPTGGSRKFCDRMNAYAQEQGLPGMGYIFWRGNPDPRVYPALRKWYFGDVAGRSEILAVKAELSPKDRDAVDRILELLPEDTSKADLGTADQLIHEYFAPDREAAGPLAKNIGPERTEAIRQQLGLGVGDAAFFLGGHAKDFQGVAGRARNVIGEELGLTDKDRFAFAWIVDFPIYEKDAETGKIDFEHNPFSMPQGGMAALEGDPLAVKGFQYDLACNGYELISGAIRNHRRDLMFKAFEIAGYTSEEVETRFPGLSTAFRFGAPPHGGCAAGIDRIVMLLADEVNIREVIMFPMNQRAEDLMMGAPSLPTNDQLRELSLRVLPKE